MAFEKDAMVNILHMGNIVGDGVLKKKGPKARLQGSLLPGGCYGVQVTSVLATEPVPLIHRLPKDGDIVTLQQAVGRIVAWPFNAVVRPKTLLFIL